MNWQSRFKQLYVRFAPPGVLDPDDINHWKEKILYTLIFIIVFLVFILCVANFPYLVEQNHWVIISTITFAYLCCLVIFLFPAIGFKKRAAIISFLVYSAGISIIFTVGPFVAPREYLFLFSIIASVLLGWFGAIVSIVTNIITFIGIGILIKTGFWQDLFLPTDPVNLWFQVSTDLVFINVCTALFVAFLFQRIEKSDREAKASSKLLLLEQQNLIKSKNRLEKEFKERKQAEADKLKAQKIADEHGKQALIGQIAGKMAHDFNNILSIIMGVSELSLIDCKDREIKNALQLIFEQTLRGKNLTKNLVAFAKDNEPKQEFFDINTKIDLVLSLMKKDLEGIELLLEKGTDLPELLADPGMIEHAFVNLIQNAIHATSLVDRPEIILKTFSLKKQICFSIEDNGCGIPEKDLDNIYEPSFTLKGSRDLTGSYKTGIKGTGYGMSNVKKYIEQHSGSISVESTAGKSTRFTIRLPVVKKELTREERKEIQKETVYSGKHVLVVEDEAAIAQVQSRILTQEPYLYTVDTADSAPEAIALFMKNEYDLISLDYILPGKLNGMDVYHHIRQTDKKLPILFISGNIEFLESIKNLKTKDGYIDHLSKPCKNIEYARAINQLYCKSENSC